MRNETGTLAAPLAAEAQPARKSPAKITNAEEATRRLGIEVKPRP